MIELMEKKVGNAVSLVEVLRARAERQADRRSYMFLDDQGRREQIMTYGDLDHRARIIGGFLQSFGEDGDRVVLLYPPSLEYVAAFLGCLYAGRVAVPLYPPRAAQKKSRVGRVIESCGATCALTSTASRASVSSFLSQDERRQNLDVFATDGLEELYADRWAATKVSGDTLAFLQYTSGSTGVPKGVMVSHRNLMMNEEAIARAFATTTEDVCASWLPLYHDMGLIGTVLQSLYRGFLSHFDAFAPVHSGSHFLVGDDHPLWRHAGWLPEFRL